MGVVVKGDPLRDPFRLVWFVVKKRKNPRYEETRSLLPAAG